jgi:hypothetical protein
MKSAARIAAVAALTFASLTLAQAQAADAEKREVVALADASAAHGTAAQVSLDAYAGRYAAKDGRAFTITVDDDGLTLETPRSSGFVLVTLRALDAATFESADGAIRVSFDFAADGEVSGASIAELDARETVATTREPLRGIVTIIDPIEDAAAAGLLRRGVVTIEDVAGEVAAIGVTAAN